MAKRTIEERIQYHMDKYNGLFVVPGTGTGTHRDVVCTICDINLNVNVEHMSGQLGQHVKTVMHRQNVLAGQEDTSQEGTVDIDGNPIPPPPTLSVNNDSPQVVELSWQPWSAPPKKTGGRQKKSQSSSRSSRTSVVGKKMVNRAKPANGNGRRKVQTATNGNGRKAVKSTTLSQSGATGSNKRGPRGPYRKRVKPESKAGPKPRSRNRKKATVLSQASSTVTADSPQREEIPLSQATVSSSAVVDNFVHDFDYMNEEEINLVLKREKAKYYSNINNNFPAILKSFTSNNGSLGKELIGIKNLLQQEFTGGDRDDDEY